MKLMLARGMVVADAFVASSRFVGLQVAGVSDVVVATSQSNVGVTMKIFDWKRRTNPDGMVLDQLSPDTLKHAPGARHRKKRKGRGISAGQGASCGFGMRGQKSRSGVGVRAGFEGGQQPLYRRLPKYVGRPMGPGHTKKKFNLIKIEALNSAEAGSVVSFESLLESGATTKTKHRWHKIVAGGDLNVSGLTVQAHGFTKGAVEAIEANNGKCQLLSPTTNEVLDMGDGDEQEAEDTVAEDTAEEDTQEDA